MQLLLAVLALAVISVTMLIRANDLRWRKEWKWRIRLVCFVITCFSSAGVALCLCINTAPGWYFTLMLLGLAGVFMTTPYLPPWWEWVWRGGPDPEVPLRRRSDRAQAVDRNRDENP